MRVSVYMNFKYILHGISMFRKSFEANIDYLNKFSEIGNEIPFFANSPYLG